MASKHPPFGTDEYSQFSEFPKSFFLHSPIESFTISIFGFDITKIKEYQEADLIHIHCLSKGFINLKSLSKVDKPIEPVDPKIVTFFFLIIDLPL